MAGNDSVPPTDRPDTRFTYDDFLLFPDDGKRHEIIDGEHYVTPSPNLRHQDLAGRLHLAIGSHVANHPGIGRVFLAPLDVVFSYHDVVEPDLLFVAGDQLDILTPQNIQGAPALVVEVLSPGTRKRDEQIKRRLFERGGVREYWLIDPELDLVKVYRRDENDDASLPRVAELTAERHDVLDTQLLPGFSLPLADFFRPTL
jgi:Uma2 family endonuclease